MSMKLASPISIQLFSSEYKTHEQYKLVGLNLIMLPNLTQAKQLTAHTKYKKIKQKPNTLVKEYIGLASCWHCAHTHLATAPLRTQRAIVCTRAIAIGDEDTTSMRAKAGS
jgi:hypothetical protein